MELLLYHTGGIKGTEEIHHWIVSIWQGTSKYSVVCNLGVELLHIDSYLLLCLNVGGSFKLIYIYYCIQEIVEEGIVFGGGCSLLRLASKVDAIRDTLENDEQKVWKLSLSFRSEYNGCDP